MTGFLREISQELHISAYVTCWWRNCRSMGISEHLQQPKYRTRQLNGDSRRLYAISENSAPVKYAHYGTVEGA